jgi:hypothetical protein
MFSMASLMPPLTNSDNTHGGRQPKRGVDNSGHCGNIGSNGPDSNIGNTVPGNSKLKPVPE